MMNRTVEVVRVAHTRAKHRLRARSNGMGAKIMNKLSGDHPSIEAWPSSPRAVAGARGDRGPSRRMRVLRRDVLAGERRSALEALGPEEFRMTLGFRWLVRRKSFCAVVSRSKGPPPKSGERTWEDWGRFGLLGTLGGLGSFTAGSGPGSRPRRTSGEIPPDSEKSSPRMKSRVTTLRLMVRKTRFRGCWISSTTCSAIQLRSSRGFNRRDLLGRRSFSRNGSDHGAGRRLASRRSR